MPSEMKTLSLDYETFSSTDIKSCGSYRYMADPTFEILLLAYAFNNDPVTVVDLASGEPFPQDFLDALTDPAVVKTAFNAAFEREATRIALGTYCPPEQWEDTMILAAQCGLPMSLAGASEALNLGEDQAKMKEGKALIRYFCGPCKPTKTNGMRERNLPEHAPDRWEVFKRYNGQDVVAERTIRNLLLRWKPTEDEHRFWCLDARINERGIRIDTTLAKSAVEMDARYKEELTEKAIAVSGLQNPKSVAQIKKWLFDQEGQNFPSLNKKVVADVVASLQSDEAKEFMAIRAELSKSSTAKYDAMLRSACPDDHARGTFQFYGANRTGRFCLTGDHEVLTQSGWVRLDEWDGGRICVWTTQSGMLSFQDAEKVAFDYSGEMYEIRHQRCEQISTPEHKMPVWTERGWSPMTMEEINCRRFSTPFTGKRVRDVKSDESAVRVLIMAQADGHFTSEGDLRLGFKKARKVERCKTLLRRAGITYRLNSYESGVSTFIVPRAEQPIWLREFRSKTFGWWMLDEDAGVVIDELEHWDSYRGAKNSFQYTTCNKQNADVIQALCSTNGMSATLLTKERGKDHPTWDTAYILNIWTNPGHHTDIRREQMSKTQYSGKVYCAVTETGYFMVRRNGKVWITGNSGKNIQLQNLPQNHLEDLDFARQLVRSGRYHEVRALYSGVSKPLSELIRTALIPEPGHKFLVADFSAIEARVLAWLSGEQWVLDAFLSGKDIYCETASKMFKVPVEKHGQNSDLRPKGKIAVLACGYGGSVNALKAFGADKMGMTEEEMQETIDMWRSANNHSVSLWKTLERAAIRSVVHRSHVATDIHGVAFDFENGVLWMTLPSGRRIAYWGARYEDSTRHRGGKSLSYMGVDQQTKKWSRVETWGGKIVENCVQATARDCLREAMFSLDHAGFDIRAHVHDECIVTEPIDGRGVEEMAGLMSQPIPWAHGLPLRADGYECEFYQKD